MSKELTPLVQLEQVSFTYPGAEQPVLKDVSLAIHKGEFTAIVGSNGSGKSTLCKTFNGLIPHYYVGDLSGRVTLVGKDTLDHKVAELSRHMGYVYQDFENQLIRPTVLDDASFAALNYGMPDFMERGRRALERTGLKADHKEFIWQLSGGQKHLLALAGAISLEPELLVIDEPVAQLDPHHAREFYEVLRAFQQRYGTTIVVIEHHTEFIADYCTHVVLMDRGRLLWKKPVGEALVLVEPLMKHSIFPPQVTQAAYRLDSEPSTITDVDHVDQEPSYPITLEEAESYFRSRLGGGEVEGSIGATDVQQLGQEQELEPAAKLPPIIVAERVCFSYKTIHRQKKQVLRDLSVTFHTGDRVALVGNNGSGKSSLLKLITAAAKPDSGTLSVKGQPTTTVSPEQLAELVTYIYQNPEDMFIEDSIRKDIEFFLKARKVPGYKKTVDRILETFHLTELQDRDGRLLSGGQQRRASLAIGVAMNPEVILLDEPTANLDIATRKDILQMLQKLQNQVQTVIVATHDMQLAAEWANRILVMVEGRIVCDGDRERIFGDPELLKLAGLSAPQIMELSRRLGMMPLCYTVDEFVHSLRQLERRGSSYGVYTQTV